MTILARCTSVMVCLTLVACTNSSSPSITTSPISSTVQTSTISSSPTTENIKRIDSSILKAQIGLDENDIYSGFLAEPQNSPFVYYYIGNGADVYQYNRETKKFTRMPWHVRPQGSDDTLSVTQQFMLGMGTPDKDGEIRTLTLTDFVQGTQKEIERLTPPSTYTKLISEFDGSANGSISGSNNPNGFYFVEVYLDNPKISILTGERSPIATRFVDPEKY